jgi:bifunctional DNase/RNase
MNRVPAIMALGVCAILFLLAVTERAGSGIRMEDFEQATVSAEGFEIRLTSGCRALSLMATPWQIDSIKSGLSGNTPFRPGSHDLMADVINGLGGKVKMALVEDLQEDTYYARLVVSSGGRTANLDARPSDAIAIAVRTGAPVYVKKGLMQKYGENVCRMPAA